MLSRCGHRVGGSYLAISDPAMNHFQLHNCYN